MQSDDRSLKWNQHPVISTVLWILGGSSGESGANSGLSQNDSSTTLSISTSATISSSSGSSHAHSAKERIAWKDQNGGTINEYFSLQPPPSPSPYSSSSIGSVNNQPPFSPAPSRKDSRTPSGSVDLDVMDKRTKQNTRNNMHSNIYNPQASPSNVTDTENDSATTLNPSALTAFETFNHNGVIHVDGHQIPRPGSADSSQSPSWGFYVPITPPQQEMFAHHPPFAR